MVWYAAYLLLLGALFVRFRNPRTPPRVVPIPPPDEPLGLVRLHHRAVYVVLAATPIEALVLGPHPAGRLVGLVVMAAGVLLYRWGAVALGEALSPFLSPVPGGQLVRGGPYALVRHPMYLGQMMIVLGAPLLLGARVSMVLAIGALGVIARRMEREDARLRAALPGYDAYAATTKRLLPWLL
jgi:protein-S-isoprenylcysteine O-methyltransferase Ste14